MVPTPDRLLFVLAQALEVVEMLAVSVQQARETVPARRQGARVKAGERRHRDNAIANPNERVREAHEALGIEPA